MKRAIKGYSPHPNGFDITDETRQQFRDAYHQVFDENPDLAVKDKKGQHSGHIYKFIPLVEQKLGMPLNYTVKYLSGNLCHYIDEYWVWKKTHPGTTVNLSVSPIENVHGKIIGYVQVFNDGAIRICLPQAYNLGESMFRSGPDGTIVTLLKRRRVFHGDKVDSPLRILR